MIAHVWPSAAMPALIAAQRPQLRPVLRPARRLPGKRARRHRPAGVTAQMEHLMLAEHHQQQGQFVDLAPLPQHLKRTRRQWHLTAATHHRPVLFDHLGRRHQPQRCAAVAELPARLLAASAPQALRLARQSVARGRLPAVVPVLGQSRFQLLHAHDQRRHLFAQRGVLGF